MEKQPHIFSGKNFVGSKLDPTIVNGGVINSFK